MENEINASHSLLICRSWHHKRIKLKANICSSSLQTVRLSTPNLASFPQYFSEQFIQICIVMVGGGGGGLLWWIKIGFISNLFSLETIQKRKRCKIQISHFTKAKHIQSYNNLYQSYWVKLRTDQLSRSNLIGLQIQINPPPPTDETLIYI